MDVRKEIGHRIRDLRRINKMTVENLAKAANCSVHTIHSYENGRRMPTPYIQQKLAKIFGIPPEVLFAIEGKSPTEMLDYQELQKALEEYNSAAKDMVENLPEPSKLVASKAMDELVEKTLEVKKRYQQVQSLLMERYPVKYIPVFDRVPTGDPLSAADATVDWHPVEVTTKVDFALRVQNHDLVKYGVDEGDLILVCQTKTATRGMLAIKNNQGTPEIVRITDDVDQDVVGVVKGVYKELVFEEEDATDA